MRSTYSAKPVAIRWPASKVEHTKYFPGALICDQSVQCDESENDQEFLCTDQVVPLQHTCTDKCCPLVEYLSGAIVLAYVEPFLFFYDSTHFRFLWMKTFQNVTCFHLWQDDTYFPFGFISNAVFFKNFI